MQRARRAMRAMLTAVVAVGSAGVAAITGTAVLAPPVEAQAPITITGSAAVQVPPGATSMTVNLQGAAGGVGGGTGGRGGGGAIFSATLPNPTVGMSFYIVAGQNGQDGTFCGGGQGCNNPAGGAPDGGNGGSGGNDRGGGAGGGSSSVSICTGSCPPAGPTPPPSNRVVVAGGGGGGGNGAGGSQYTGGWGGYAGIPALNGNNGAAENGFNGIPCLPGLGGTQTAGGTGQSGCGGTKEHTGTNGSQGQGGTGGGTGDCCGFAGGGGGGGWYGGGGGGGNDCPGGGCAGGGGGGGGGASYICTTCGWQLASNPTYTSARTSSSDPLINGFVVVTFTMAPPTTVGTTTTTAFIFVRAQPDVSIRPAGGGSFVGHEQLLPSLQEISASLAPGEETRFEVRVANRGPESDRFRVAGSPAQDSFTAAYFDGANDITAAVNAGTYTTPSLAPGAIHTIVLAVRPPSPAAVGAAGARFAVRATAETDTRGVDEVVAALTKSATAPLARTGDERTRSVATYAAGAVIAGLMLWLLGVGSAGRSRGRPRRTLGA